MCMLHIEFASIILNSDYLLPFEGPVIEHYTRKRSKKDLKRKLMKLIFLSCRQFIWAKRYFFLISSALKVFFFLQKHLLYDLVRRQLFLQNYYLLSPNTHMYTYVTC